MPNMTGRPGHRTMEMNGGSSALYLARTPCVPLFCTLFNRGGNRRGFRLPGAGGGSFPLYGGTFARSSSVSTLPRDLFDSRESPECGKARRIQPVLEILDVLPVKGSLPYWPLSPFKIDMCLCELLLVCGCALCTEDRSSFSWTSLTGQKTLMIINSGLTSSSKKSRLTSRLRTVYEPHEGSLDDRGEMRTRKLRKCGWLASMWLALGDPWLQVNLQKRARSTKKGRVYEPTRGRHVNRPPFWGDEVRP